MADYSTNGDLKQRTIPAYVWLSIAAIAAAVYILGLSFPFVGPDEARYAQVAREMFVRGDLVTPTLGGHNWFEKPALLYWLMIGSYKLFGVNEFAARLGPAIFGLGTASSLWFLVKKVEISPVDVKVAESSQLPNWTATTAVSTLGILAFAHGASFDIIVTFPLTASMVSFYLFDRTCAKADAKGWPYLVAFYGFIGLGLLAKGLIGIVFPFAIVAFYFALSRRMPSKQFIASLFWGTFIAILIAALWYVPMYIRHGYDFIDQFIVQHHFQRFTSNKYQHPQPFYFFLWVLPLLTVPWLPFSLFAVWEALRRTVRSLANKPVGDSQPVDQPIIILCLAWAAVPSVFFSISGSKLPGYILPSVPPVIVLTSIYLFRLARNSRMWRLGILTTAYSTLICSGLIIAFFLPKYAESDSVKSLFAAAHGRGLDSSQVLMLHTISYNAEFYAAGRLQRDETGKLIKLRGPDEVVHKLNNIDGDPLLVLVPLSFADQLLSDDRVRTEKLKDNGELAIILVSKK